MKSSEKINNKYQLEVIIVNYNAGEHLINCLDALKVISKELKIKIWVVDNASSDQTIANAEKRFPEISFIKNEENLGFGAANNQALKEVASEFILLLNPDTILKGETLTVLLDYLDHNQDVGATTCKVVFENGKVDLAAHRGFPTPWASFQYLFGNDSLYHLTNRDMSIPHEVDCISGAFFLTRKSVLDKVGFFDEDYFMYAEDIDLCFRIKKLGFKIIYNPTISIIHFKGISSGLKSHTQKITTATLETKRKSVDYFHKTMKIFYKKHLEKKYPFFINWIIYLGIDFRWLLARIKLTV